MNVDFELVLSSSNDNKRLDTEFDNAVFNNRPELVFGLFKGKL